MDEGSDVMVAGISPDASPSSYVNNTDNIEEASSEYSISEDLIVDPLCNPPADTYIATVTNGDDKDSSTQEWLMAIKKDEMPVKDESDVDEGDGDEDVGTSSFENLSPLSDDTQGSTKGFRKVLGISMCNIIMLIMNVVYG